MGNNIAPEGTSFVSKTLLLWARDVYKTDEYIPLSLPRHIKESTWGPRVHNAWIELCRERLSNQETFDKNKLSQARKCNKKEENHNLTNNNKHSDVHCKSQNAVLLRIIWRVYKWPFLHMIFILCLSQVLWIIRPFLISSITTTTVESEDGYLLFIITSSVKAIALFVFMSTAGLIDKISSTNSNVTFGRLRAGLGSLVLDKITKLSPTSRHHYTSAELSSIATNSLTELCWEILFLIRCMAHLVNMIVNILLLFYFAGLSSLPGVVVFLSTTIIFYFITGFQETLYTKRTKARDYKLSRVTEILKGIKMIKLFAWEKIYGRRIEGDVAYEMEILNKIFLCNVINPIGQIVAPTILIATTLLCMILRGEHISVGDLSAVVMISLGIRHLAYEVIGLSASFIVMKEKIGSILSLLLASELEKQPDHEEKCQNNNIDGLSMTFNDKGIEVPKPIAIAINDGEFVWHHDHHNEFCLRNINVSIAHGSLVAVVGCVGSGKTAFLMSLLGELERLNGSMKIEGTIGFVPQEAWILNDDIRTNILFGNAFNKELYKSVLKSCELLPDLALFPDGDLTQLGERGHKISGGQKQRISLARAVYHDPDILLLDDPISAVDAKVSHNLFHKVIGSNGPLKSKTRIMTTNNTNILQFFDAVLYVESINGTSSKLSSVTFMTTKEAFIKCLKLEGHSISDLKYSHTEDRKESMEIESSSTLVKRLDSKLTPDKENPVECDTSNKPETNYLDGYKMYLQAVGVVGLISRIILHILPYVIFARSGLLLTEWMNAISILQEKSHSSIDVCYRQMNSILSFTNENNFCFKNEEIVDFEDKMWELSYDMIVRYLELNILSGIIIVIYQIVFAKLSAESTRKIANNLLWSVLKSPMTLFQKTPIGRFNLIFGYDIHEIGRNIPDITEHFLNQLCRGVIGVALVCYSCPNMIFAFLPMISLIIHLHRKNGPVITRLEKRISEGESEIYSHVHETVEGVHVVRAFNQQKRFTNIHHRNLDKAHTLYYNMTAATRWSYLEVQFITNLWVASVTFFVMINSHFDKQQMSGVGLIPYALQLGHNIFNIFCCFSDLKVLAVSLGRVSSLISTPNETSWSSSSEDTLPHDWPTEGDITFDKFYLKYDKQNAWALNSISIKIKAGEKIGIVGRTGAGKSSLASSLFRITEASSGTISIDGIDISKVGLHDLRSRIAVIPQDPILFFGSLRSNLDPEGRFPNESVWTALRSVEMASVIESLPGALMSECAEDGSNFSLGQKQLLCLARAILNMSKVIVLDEATSSMDLQTDMLIQRVVRSEFAKCTVLIIAHRLSSILDCDRILVMDGGRVVNFDSVDKLKVKCSLFRDMLKLSSI